jgi:hypothetical protein
LIGTTAIPRTPVSFPDLETLLAMKRYQRDSFGLRESR